jgi:4-amino-4-deoxy-L-arabinose transferase-like glycosyltransferase
MITQANEPEPGRQTAQRTSAEGSVAQADEHAPDSVGGASAGEHGPVAPQPRTTGPSTATLLYWMSCTGVLLWALILNFIRLGPSLIMPDEGTYAMAAWRYVQGTVSPAIRLSPGSNSGPLPIGQSSAQINADNFQHPPLGKWLLGLSQLVAGHQSITADRTVAAIATVLTGFIIVVWVGRAAGRWTGLLAGAFVLLLPEAVQGSDGLRLGRFGLLDPIAELFVVVYLLLMWEWFRSGRRRAWVFAVASGLAIGAATASKENGFLAAVVPILIWLVAAGREPRLLGRRLGQTAVALMAGLVVFVVTYLPFSTPFLRIRYLIDFQRIHSNDGHLIGLAGEVTWHPPWWANLWFAGHGMGAAVTIVVLAFAAVACVFRRDRLVAFCAAALIGPVIFHCFIAGVALSFYWTLWMPPLLVLTALGVMETARRLQATSLPKFVALGVPLIALLIPVVACLSLTVRTADVKAAGPEVLRPVLAHHGLHGPVLSSGIYQYEYTYYDEGMGAYLTPPQSLRSVHAVVIGAPQCRLEPDNRATRAIAAVNLAARRLKKIYVDSAMTVYEVTRPLITPSPAQIAAQPPTNLAAGC